MVRHVLACLSALLLAVPAFAQDVNVHLGGMGVGMDVQVRDPGGLPPGPDAPIPAESYRLDFEPNHEGATLMKVVAPEGALLQVWNGKKMVHEDDIPTSFAAAPDTFYRFLVKLPDGRVWEKKLASKRRSTGTLAVVVPAPVVQQVVVAPPAPQPQPQVVVIEKEERHHRHHDRHDDAPPPAMGPQPMMDSDFGALCAAIEAESFEAQKLAVLSTAASSSWFTVAQVGTLVDLLTFSDGKVKVVSITRAHILDTQNAYQLYGHYTFDSDKKKVKAILGQ